MILGTGSIGSHLAHVAKQFGLRVVGVNRTGIPAKEGQLDATYHISELPAALMRADLLVNTLPIPRNRRSAQSRKSSPLPPSAAV